MTITHRNVVSYVMPFLVFNLGGEMLYILDQRLKAQNIKPEKSVRVIDDVATTMFNEQFIIELFKPQEIYSHTSTREIFDRLAHSSIMRLSKPSMDKLYDLMTMGFKYQLLMMAYPEEIIQVTLNHLDALRKMISTNEVHSLVEKGLEQLNQLISHLTIFDYMVIQQELLNFFQDRHVKVSLFLSSGIQYQNGTYAIHRADQYPIPYENQPGTVHYVQENRSVPLSNHPGRFTKNNLQIHLNVNERSSNYGFNMYIKKQQKKSEETKPSVTVISSSTSASEFMSMDREEADSSSSGDSNTLVDDSKFKRYAESSNIPHEELTSRGDSGSELNLLAQLIGGVEKGSKGKIEHENFLHISNLFGKDSDPIETDDQVKTAIVSSSELKFESNDQTRLGDLSRVMEDFDLNTDSNKKLSGDQEEHDHDEDDDGDDLLDLMDAAG